MVLGWDIKGMTQEYVYILQDFAGIILVGRHLLLMTFSKGLCSTSQLWYGDRRMEGERGES